MQLFQNLFNRSKQFNQAPVQPSPMHAQQGRYKIIHQAIKIPNLPTPLHYLNFYTLIGQPRAPIFQQSHLNICEPLNVATVMVSTSMHSVGHFHAYDVTKECRFNNQTFDFSKREHILGNLPHLELQRQDRELGFQLQIKTLDLLSYFYQLPWALGQYWSIPCQCQGEVICGNQTYQINQLGVLEYARSIDFAYLPIAFYTYQLISLTDTQQLIILQLRDQFSSILYSRLYLKDSLNQQIRFYDAKLDLHIQRLYPLVKTPNHQSMYLPRVFGWSLKHSDISIDIQAESRGDFKFGLGAGFVGSFSYKILMNNQTYQGEHGYIEYVDCRSLKYQEIDQSDKQRISFAATTINVMKNE